MGPQNLSAHPKYPPLENSIFVNDSKVLTLKSESNRAILGPCECGNQNAWKMIIKLYLFYMTQYFTQYCQNALEELRQRAWMLY